MKLRRSLRRTFFLATLTNLAHPKVILFYLAFFPQFLDPHAAWAVTVQFLVLGPDTHRDRLRRRREHWFRVRNVVRELRRHPAVRTWLDRISAAVFGALAIRLVVADQGN